MNGYQSREYALALAEFGRARWLPGCAGWILDRPIPGLADRDGVGPYPLFCCRNWPGLADDIQGLEKELVSLVLVADPFCSFDAAGLNVWFNAGAVPFKEHHVVELGPRVEELASRHHRRNLRKALGLVNVERVEEPTQSLDDWRALYDVLIARHEIRGMSAFSGASFAHQFAVPGLVAFRARANGKTVGMLLWFVQGDVAYYHLGAYNQAGYECNASYALFWNAIAYFTGRLRWLDLGAGAGLGNGSAGLDRFKAGWATGTRTAYLCRHILQVERYEHITALMRTEETHFFPAYRSPELASSPSRQE
jgi:hypothetical protein